MGYRPLFGVAAGLVLFNVFILSTTDPLMYAAGMLSVSGFLWFQVALSITTVRDRDKTCARLHKLVQQQRSTIDKQSDTLSLQQQVIGRQRETIALQDRTIRVIQGHYVGVAPETPEA